MAIGSVVVSTADPLTCQTEPTDGSWLDIAPQASSGTAAAIKDFVESFTSLCPGLAGPGADFPCAGGMHSGIPFRMSRHDRAGSGCDGCARIFGADGANGINDLLVIPRLSGSSAPGRALIFLSGTVLDADEVRFLHASAGLYFTQQALWESGRRHEPDVALKSREIECIRWAVTGRTLSEIAAVMGLSYRTVRFHLDSARSRYGFSTNQQLFVQAAKDYGLDPNGTPQTIRQESPVVAVPQLRRMQPLWEDRRGAFDRRSGDRRQADVAPLPFADRRAAKDRRASDERRAVAESSQSSTEAILTPEEIRALLN
ncbi:helix-turn-helix transcriptional regulator [Shumkonia mesophila]|uniref:helix-turn-helix transcriptional regulator n=1 Tax=Shumkonia mesophila TaxID=2838854 RepID=UPI0029350E86|nr:LuxR C-terminal-related transcriptional regulator [Shumkonia mesophila]